MFVGFMGALTTALVGQSDLIGEPYKHYMVILGIVCSTTIAYFSNPPRDNSSRDRVSDNKLRDLNK